MLSFQELKQIAELVYHPGYVLMIDAVQAYVDDLASELRNCDPSRETQCLAKWRVASEILNILRTNPEKIALEVRAENQLQEEILGPQLEEQYNTYVPTNLAPEQVNALKAAYERKMKEIKK